jgi:hypothetical protein
MEGPEPSGPLDTTPENPLLRRHELVGRMGQQAASLANRAEDRGTMVRRDPVLLTTLLCLDPVGVLVRLKASGSDIARAAAVLSGPSEPPSLSVMAVRRWMAAVGDAADDLTAIWHMRNGVEPLWEPVMRGIRERGEPLTRRMLAVTGGDLQAVGIAPGPGMGHVLDRLLALVVDDPSQNTRETLLAHARKLA